MQQVLSTVLNPSVDSTLWLYNNIFRTKYTSKGKDCTIIIDGRSCENMVATSMVGKLALKMETYPNPYQLTWLKKVNVVFLGRPWQYDIHTKHDGFKNTYSFHKDGLNITFRPSTPVKRELKLSSQKVDFS